jgi:hypothetical protein
MQHILFPHKLIDMFLDKKRDVTAVGRYEAWLWRRWQSWTE